MNALLVPIVLVWAAAFVCGALALYWRAR